MFAIVSWAARAKARPPMPRPVRKVFTSNPRLSKTTRMLKTVKNAAKVFLMSGMKAAIWQPLGPRARGEVVDHGPARAGNTPKDHGRKGALLTEADQTGDLLPEGHDGERRDEPAEDQKSCGGRLQRRNHQLVVRLRHHPLQALEDDADHEPAEQDRHQHDQERGDPAGGGVIHGPREEPRLKPADKAQQRSRGDRGHLDGDQLGHGRTLPKPSGAATSSRTQDSRP